ncbi:hypothetical protein N7499_003519 [Penicillium canescens]|uniref:Uncharacterized protein n=1 Tax=Penicillium canescens TaxID=5083 RepID=A0AAD6I995_PENCN|nr:uncharacterized protein N7446_012445 [Penicillium canescens]KAJ6020229.1 hypothetical protein N7522_000304 [Penicillium canescens]KAJ6038183.1 hypothetical protein N7460_007954 [Penicillium canescens]KAJ6045581.1 hypothetical protein N7446_012445 [Penicillium canescens]KAJ6061266.1 hypothetical protein N7444_001962 [Penicillium canescens]KAJ6090805.1 hypothetical protein N7499_003519 [Penicillium canescens]
MDGLPNEHEAKVEQDQGRGSVPPGYINGLPEYPAMQDLGQQPLPQLHLPPDEAHALAAEPFQPLVEELKRLNQDDPQLAHQAAQIVRLYRRLYESYVARKSESQRLEKANGELRTANLQLCQESELLKVRYAEQEEELAYFGQAFDKLSSGIGSLLVDSEGCSSEPMYEAASRVNEGGP